MDEVSASAAEVQRSAEATIQLFIHPSKHSSIALTSSPLDGSNFLAWQRAVYVSLGTKMKLGFIDGSFPRPAIGSINFELWRHVDLMVTSWIWNSMSKDIVESFMFCATSRELWLAIQARCGGCSCGINKAIDDLTSSTHVMQFLMGLHDSFNNERSQILMLDPLPDIEKTFSMVYAVEEQRSVQNDLEINSNHMACQLEITDNRKASDRPAQQRKPFVDKRNLLCTHCHRKGHARDTCFQLNGVPEWYRTLGDKKKKGRPFAANVEHREEAVTSSQNVADIVAEVLKVMQKNNAPSDPLTNFANYAQFDDDFAVNQLCLHKRYRLLFTQNGCVLQDQDAKANLVVGVLFRRLYVYKQDHKIFTEFSHNSLHNVSFSASVHCSVSVWHNRLGHASMEAIKHIKDVDGTEFSSNSPCDICHKAKQSRVPFPVSSSHAAEIFDLVHMDLWGPYKANSISGYTYLLTLVDDHSRCMWIFLLKQRNLVPTTLKGFCSMVHNQFGKGIKVFRSDNGSEFINQEFRMLCANFGIIHQTSCTYTPQQNGRVERKHRQLLNVARALLLQASLPIKFWSEAILTAAYLINRTPTRVLGWQTPYEKLYGYAMHQKAYKFFDLDAKTIFYSRDVQFYEREFPYSDIPSDVSSIPMPNVTLQSDDLVDASSQPVTLTEQNDIPATNPVLDPPMTDIIGSDLPPLRRSPRHTQRPGWLNDFVSSVSSPSLLHSCNSTYSLFMASLSTLQEPRTYLEAVKHVEWQAAMKAELDAMERNCTWSLTPLPVGKRPIGCKWVFKTKLRADGSVERHKARLVAKGFNQVAGIDYNDNFSPVAKTVTVRLFLTLAAAHGWPLQQIDVNNAFLHGRLDEDLYMTPPEVITLHLFLTRPCEAHWRAAVHVVRYLKGTPSKGLFLPSTYSFLLRAYCDADWASCTDSRRSLTGFCIFFGDALVSWKTKKQSMVSRSTAEAEYRSMAATVCELRWISYILSDLGLVVKLPIQLFCDNQAALHIMANPVFHERTKHIELDCHVVRDAYKDGFVSPSFVRSASQLADLFTKPLPLKLFAALLDKSGLAAMYPSPTCGGVLNIQALLLPLLLLALVLHIWRKKKMPSLMLDSRIC
ncbi:UNVERIFIED_CONTAM: Retrovirus-related Pol polyprotein from transposon RE2 [Sesamum radiatum]|uniref:Retrovirus-related Pol polyprotein from transposon RE2 n=1 Tax=Sesamum radiatum TaxID=300843 RepID=A0AAW2QH30_SESRA